MTIHVTPIPSTIDFVAPEFSLAESNIAGSATTAVSSNSTLLAFDTTVPAAISTGTVASATGSAVVSSRRDHVHGSTAIVGAATQAEMEAASDNTVYVTPGREVYHPATAKAWTDYSSIGAPAANADYGIASYSDISVGITRIFFTTAMTSGDYAAVGGRKDGGTHIRFSATYAGDFRSELMNSSFTAEDGEGTVAIFGGQD